MHGFLRMQKGIREKEAAQPSFAPAAIPKSTYPPTSFSRFRKGGRGKPFQRRPPIYLGRPPYQPRQRGTKIRRNLFLRKKFPDLQKPSKKHHAPCAAPPVRHLNVAPAHLHPSRRPPHRARSFFSQSPLAIRRAIWYNDEKTEIIPIKRRIA